MYQVLRTALIDKSRSFGFRKKSALFFQAIHPLLLPKNPRFSFFAASLRWIVVKHQSFSG
ncbi:MAG: hypothetical protein A2351_04605 [Omnitrophica bacterium RIFOXYB12_FULL_50_7]|nr:MAG: hypothetical protein A2351_04605 [Omnitrophica bacterium RIFOXYB12_FULL_50_7]